MAAPAARIAIAALLLYVFPYFPGIRSLNSCPEGFYLVQAMADHGTFAIDAGVARLAPPPASRAAARPRAPASSAAASAGHFYSNKAPGFRRCSRCRPPPGTRR
ncbi:MAG: hypothetical protein R2939_18235 [Kofleriaceae bacterium]